MAKVIINERKANNNFIAAGTDANGTVYREPKPQEAIEIAWTGIVTNADGNFIEPTKDHKTVVLVKNEEASASKYVEFKAGNSYHAADFRVTLAAGKEEWVTLESANFTDKETGLIEVTTDETTASKVFIAVLETR